MKLNMEISKKENNYYCDHCNTLLTEDTLGHAQKVEQYYKISLTSDGYIEYDSQDFNPLSDPGIFYCRNCGWELGVWDEKLAIKILKASQEVVGLTSSRSAVPDETKQR